MPDTIDLSELRDNYVWCRTYGHSWDEFHPENRNPTTFKHYMALRCTRCTTQRFDYEGVLGEIIDREYKYPEGYALAGTMTRAQFRLEIRRRRKAAARKR